MAEDVIGIFDDAIDEMREDTKRQINEAVEEIRDDVTIGMDGNDFSLDTALKAIKGIMNQSAIGIRDDILKSRTPVVKDAIEEVKSQN